MREHQLKCWHQYFDAIRDGDKNFEVRRDDRGFQKGDILKLCRTQEDRPDKIEYFGFGAEPAYVVRKRITYILTGGQFGIEPGYVVLALEDVQS